MRFADAVEFALGSLRKRRLRTFLTASGVMIGIGALVSMISFGKGMQKNVTQAFKSSDLLSTLVVMPGGAEPPAAVRIEWSSKDTAGKDVKVPGADRPTVVRFAQADQAQSPEAMTQAKAVLGAGAEARGSWF